MLIIFRKKKNRIELRLDDVVPILRFFIEHTTAQRHIAGIVYQYADAAEFALDPIQCGFQSGAIGHIDPHCNRTNTDCLQFGKDALILFLISSQHRDGSPGFGQPERNGATNSAISTGHHSDTTA